MPASAGMTVGLAEADASLTTSSARRRGSTQIREVARALGLLLAMLLLFALPAVAQPKFPTLTDRIVDEAGLLGASDRAAIREDLKALEAKSSDQLVIYTTRSLQGYPIEDFGYQLGRAWGIGQKGVNNGVLLIIAPNERKVRIEVGRGLEPFLTDAMTKLIIENAILPAFRRGDFAAGIKAGVHDIKDVMLGDAEAVKQRAEAGKKRSTGSPETAIAFYFLVFFIFAAFFMVWVQQRQMAHPVKNGLRRRAGYAPGSSSGWNSGSSWGSSSGSWSGSSSDSGGFSGGGGDFGGGGSSGSW